MAWKFTFLMKRRKSIDTFSEGKWTQKTKNNFFIVVVRLRTYLIFVIFFTRTKFLENKIYTEKTRKLQQNTQKIANFLRYYGKIHSKLPIFRVKSVKIYTGQKKFTREFSWLSWQIWGMYWSWTVFDFCNFWWSFSWMVFEFCNFGPVEFEFFELAWFQGWGGVQPK